MSSSNILMKHITCLSTFFELYITATGTSGNKTKISFTLLPRDCN